jgi:O-antigen/teichoic acid export membrane protein
MRFLKHLSLYTLVGVIGAAINFFVMPVLSNYLAPGDYGLLSLFNTYVTILIPLISISAYSLLTVEYFKEKDKSVFASKFISIQFLPVFTTIPLVIITWLFYGKFADDLEIGNTTVKWGYIVLLITLFSIYFDQFFNFLILEKKAVLFTIYMLAKVSIEVLLTLYFVVIKGWGWQGRMYSWFVTSGLFFILGFMYFQRQGFLKGTLRWKYISEGLIFGAPLVLHGVGKFVVNQSDRIFIAKMVSIDEAGVYNVGYTAGMLVMIVVNAFFNFYNPFLMERLADLTEGRKIELVKMGYLYGLGCIILLLLVILLTPIFFSYFINKRYHSGANYVFWVALGYCFWGGYMLFSGFIFFFKRNSILAWLAIFNVLSNLLFNYVFIKYFGAIGAAYATALSFFLVFIVVAQRTQKLLPLPWLKVFNKMVQAKKLDGITK